MTDCIVCGAELEIDDVEIGEVILCDYCGANMDVVGIQPLELELMKPDGP